MGFKTIDVEKGQTVYVRMGTYTNEKKEKTDAIIFAFTVLDDRVQINPSFVMPQTIMVAPKLTKLEAEMLFRKQT